MSTWLLSDDAIALALTLVIEVVGMIAFSLLMPAQRSHLLRNGLLVMGLNVITHSVFWATLPLLPVGGLEGGCGYEIFIVFIEGLVYTAACGLAPGARCF